MRGNPAPVRTQLTELSYSTLNSLAILSGIPSLVRSSHNAGRLRVKCSMEIYKCCKSWMAEILPPLCNVTQGCYAITCRVTRHESALLRTPVWQQCWFDSCNDDMCKHLARHGNQSYASITAALRLGSFSFIQRHHDTLMPFLRNHFLFPDPSDYFVQCARLLLKLLSHNYTNIWRHNTMIG